MSRSHYLHAILTIKLKHGITVNFVSSKTEILLDVTTPQDLLVEIGAPLRVFYKEEDKMRIHSEENILDSSDSNHKDSIANGVTNNGVNEHPRKGDFAI